MTLGNKAELRKTDCYFRTCDEAGAFAARYDYDAFGNLVASSGPMADFFPHRFSTKCYDPDLGLYYYGYRWYSPELGRWISRDLIEEADDFNLFGFMKNNPASGFDSFGLYRYITDFAIWKPFSWHIGIAVDTWRKVKTGSEECCWAWTWTGFGHGLLLHMDWTSLPNHHVGHRESFSIPITRTCRCCPTKPSHCSGDT